MMSVLWLKRNLPLATGVCLLTLAGLSGAQASYLSIKANLAQLLMERSWTKNTLVSQRASKPWHWADMATTAKLSYRLHTDAEKKSLIVLDNASGEAMAFGPGLVAGQLNQASQSTIALGGHRDSHLAFLEYANQDTTFELQIPDGKALRYQFEDAFVVNSTTQQLQIATDQPGLVLITCYPFNAMQTGGPLRLVVRATLVTD